MGDVVDMAADLQDEHLALSLQRARVPIPEGVAGECEQCFEDSPRLVGGRCAFCRDGRRRPSNPTGRAPMDALEPIHQSGSAHAASQPVREETQMGKSITFIADGDVLAEIKRRTADGTSNNRAALDLLEAGLAAIAGNQFRSEAQTIDLATADTADLIGEITRRLTSAADTAALQAAEEQAASASARADEAEARAAAAEGKLDALRAALAA